jgi:hypothetical protein
VAAVVVLGLALLAAGCGERDTPPVRRAVAFHPAPDVRPIDRLGRWNGTTFVPVPPGSIGGGDVYVLVHGWAPGYLAAVRRATGPEPLPAWSPQAVNAQGRPMFTSFFTLAAAITRAVPATTVLAFSWLDDSATAPSATDAWKSEAHTDLNGQRLATALGQALAPGFAGAGDRLHLIGNGHGAKVATVAAIALEQPPEQLTLLDSPEDGVASLPGAANHLEGYLPLLPIGRGSGQTFVDSYFSVAGVRYGTFPALEAVVDVELDPAPGPGATLDQLVARHRYPVEWYAKSAQDPAAGVGFGWSPPSGRPPECIGCNFGQDWLRPDGRVDRADELRLEPVRVTVRRKQLRRPLEVQPLRGPSAPLRPDGVVLSAPGHRLWQVTFDRDPDDLAIEFDDRFTALGDGAQLAVWLDNRQLLVTAADWSGPTGHHAVVDVSALEPGRHTFTAVLARPSSRFAGAPARVILGHFVAVSEPGVGVPKTSLSVEAKVALLALAVLAAIALLAWALRRDKRRPATILAS